MPETHDYTDINGILRRPGSLILPPSFVCAMPPFEGQPGIPDWTDADIRREISGPDWEDIEKLMPSKKYVKQQHSTSACNTYAAAAGIDAARFMRGIDDDFRAAGSFLYTFINNGRDAGSQLHDALIAGQKHGFASEDLVKWQMIFTRHIPKAAFAEGLKHKSFKPYRVMTIQGLRTALALRYMVIVAVQCGKLWDKRSNGVQGVQPGPGNHAILTRSIKPDGKKFRYPTLNSWGPEFADDGSTDLIDAHFDGTMPNHAFYAISTTSES